MLLTQSYCIQFATWTGVRTGLCSTVLETTCSSARAPVGSRYTPLICIQWANTMEYALKHYQSELWTWTTRTTTHTYIASYSSYISMHHKSDYCVWIYKSYRFWWFIKLDHHSLLPPEDGGERWSSLIDQIWISKHAPEMKQPQLLVICYLWYKNQHHNCCGCDKETEAC